jgi:hypothetical protein
VVIASELGAMMCAEKQIRFPAFEEGSKYLNLRHDNRAFWNHQAVFQDLQQKLSIHVTIF